MRLWDAEPHLWASSAHESLVHDYAWFTQLHVEKRTLTWTARNSGEQELDFAPEFLFKASWPLDGVEGSTTRT